MLFWFSKVKYPVNPCTKDVPLDTGMFNPPEK